ncbi:MAG: hypothetical protein ACTHKP_01870 [Nitrososphaeraceae archaeon]
MAFGIFEEILRLVEYIPIRSDVPINSKLEDNVTIDSQFRFHDIDGVVTRLGIIEPAIDTLVSLRDIVKLLNKFLKDGKIEEIVSKKRYNVLQDTIRSNNYFKYSSALYQSSGLPLKGLLFDFCLSVLDASEERIGSTRERIKYNDRTIDTKLYLTHCSYLLGLHKRLTIVLAVIANEPSLHQDKDVRQLLTLLARLSEPDNIDIYFDGDNNGFNNRYAIYLRELKDLAIQLPSYTKNGEQNIIKKIKTPEVELGGKK